MVKTNCQLFTLIPNLLNPKVTVLGGGGGDDQLPTFDAESKSAKIPKSHYRWGGVGVVTANFQR